MSMGEPSGLRAQGREAWVLVAGTGQYHLPENVRLAAAAVGESIARHGCGLVTGGWQGVDYIVAEAFAKVEAAKGHRLEDRLLQVVREDRCADFNGGRVVLTKAGPLEWLEPQSYCDAVVLIGGIGGTYGSFLSALHKGIPRFPLPGTAGDAATAFRNMCELWDALPNPGISKSDFEGLDHQIKTAEDAAEVAERVVSLITQSVNYRSGHSPKSVFISYSRKDTQWLQEIRLILQPLEHRGHVRIWTDLDIEAGDQWDQAIRRQLQTCDAALVLVSPHFQASRYAQTVELPVLLERARAQRTLLLWLLVSPTVMDQVPLAQHQAFDNMSTPLETMTEAERHIYLVRLHERLQRLVTNKLPSSA